MSKLSKFEETLLVKTRLLDSWITRNSWVKGPVLIGVTILGIFGPFWITLTALGVLLVYGAIMWNIFNKI